MIQSIHETCHLVQQDHHLTDAETHVLELLTKGHPPKEVAAIRGRSVETVRTQIKALKSKLVVYRTCNLPDLVFSYMQAQAA